MRKHPEVLAPVGNWEMCRAAVHNGADAIYLGLPGFNARGRAELFDVDTLKGMIEFCHLYGTKVFIASNVLLFEREIKDLTSLLYEIIPLHPDAFIVQDIGVVRLIHQICPTQIIHASTQMTVTNYEAIELTADLAIQRYVLGRECSIDEVRKIRGMTSKELEVFVHGALCVSYSGQCLTSESFGGRSANRGQCAQSCRLDYELIVDGKKKELGERRYLVSPQDLCSLDDVDRLVEAGVDSFKIEGRLKSPLYVAETVRQYKAAVMDEQSLLNPTNLSLAYSRGFYNGWMDGVNHQQLVDARYSNHHGLEVGEVRHVAKHVIRIQTEAELQPGDGVVFSDFKKNFEVGASLYSVERNGKEVTLTFASEFDCLKVTSGMRIFLNASPAVVKKAERSWTVREELRRIPITIRVAGKIGEPLVVSFEDSRGNCETIHSTVLLEQAKTAGLTDEQIRDVLGALGTTPFIADRFLIEISDSLFLHSKYLKEIRRLGVEALTKGRIARKKQTLCPQAKIVQWIDSTRTVERSKSQTTVPALSVLVRDLTQLDELVGSDLKTVYLDFEFGKDYSDAVSRVRTLGFEVGIATTRILKPGELGHLKVIERLRPDTILVRNLGALQYFQHKGIPLVGDFSLNVSNSLTAEWIFEKGVAAICPSYDLNAQQLLDLLETCGGERFEVTMHQYMPAFHMEHCVFAAFLSEGKSFRDCGRPCEKHRVELRDHTGALHPLKPDAECRNTMFNGTAQSGAKLIPDLLAKNVGSLRIEALYETARELRNKIDAYAKLIRGEVTPAQVSKTLAATEKFGVTDGQLFNIRVHKDRRKGDIEQKRAER